MMALQLPIGNETNRDGYYKYTFRLKDKAGNEKEVQIETTVDTTAPEVVIDNPGTGTTGKTGINAIDGSSYQFKGSAAEERIISGIYYKVISLSDSSTSTAAPSADLLNGESWTNEGWKSVTAERSWSFYRDISTG